MKKGFTLIEITAVVAIIIILSSIFVVNYREGERQFALQRSAHKLAQDIRRTQEMAMAGQEFDGVFPEGGYGIYLKENQGFYYLFADCNDNDEFDETGAAQSCKAATVGNPFPETVEMTSLEENIMVSSLSGVGNILEITFFPPDPTTTINPSASSASIELSFNGFPLTVTVNSVGLIDIQ